MHFKLLLPVLSPWFLVSHADEPAYLARITWGSDLHHAKGGASKQAPHQGVINDALPEYVSLQSPRKKRSEDTGPLYLSRICTENLTVKFC